MSGLDDNGSQSERLKRQVSHWKTLHAGGRDTIILGDANLCALKWEEDTFQNKEQRTSSPDSGVYARDIKLSNGEGTHVAGNHGWRNHNLIHRPLLYKRTRKNKKCPSTRSR